MTIFVHDIDRAARERPDQRAQGLAAPQHAVRPIQVLAASSDALVRAWHARRERLWLSIVAVPLALVATGLLDWWLTWPVFLAIARAYTRTWRWFWVLSLELGIIGVMWATLGITALASFPNNRLVVGVVWVAFPLALAVAGIVNRRRAASPSL